MRVLLAADMEGSSWITNHRECWIVFPEYWQTGRARMTADVVAAARGLLEGGATQVIVANLHGPGGWPNLLPEQFPDGCELLVRGNDPGEFDALFQVGCHARCGTLDGFASHTHVPNLCVKLDGRLIAENHEGAWALNVPLLGVTGDAALGPQLDGLLAGTPFLTVKRSTSRTATQPVERDPEESARAIQEFARRCAGERRDRTVAQLPDRYTVAFSMPKAIADAVPADDLGLRRVSPAVLEMEAGSWVEAVRPALFAIAGATSDVYLGDRDDLAVTSEEAMRAQDAIALDRLRNVFDDWMASPQAEWQA